jgi:hypothetical protein
MKILHVLELVLQHIGRAIGTVIAVVGMGILYLLTFAFWLALVIGVISLIVIGVRFVVN